MSETEVWARLTGLLEDREGIWIPPQRESFLKMAVGLRMREIGCRTVGDYYDLILNDGPEGDAEWCVLVDRATVQESAFFRHEPEFAWIRTVWIPERLKRGRGCTVWSVGCASGEELYGVGMLLDEAGCRGGYALQGMDLSLTAIERARAGVYTDAAVARVPKRLKERYLEPLGDGRVRVVERLRRRSCFLRLNVLEIARWPLGAADLIICWNTLMYVAPQRRVAVIDALACKLTLGGLLMLSPLDIVGIADAVGRRRPELRRVSDTGLVIYRRGAMSDEVGVAAGFVPEENREEGRRVV